MILLGYLPLLGAGTQLSRDLTDFAAHWEGNDSLFRLFPAAGNSTRQAQLVAVVSILFLIAYVLKSRMDIVQASLVVLAGLPLLSLNSFPWYFTWIAPFLCFCTRPALLLLIITCVLGYAPVIAYAACGPFSNSPLIQVLEYLPALALLGYEVAGHFQRRQSGERKGLLIED